MVVTYLYCIVLNKEYMYCSWEKNAREKIILRQETGNARPVHQVQPAAGAMRLFANLSLSKSKFCHYINI